MSTCRSIHVSEVGGRRYADRCLRDHRDPQRTWVHGAGEMKWVALPRIHWRRTYHDPYNRRPSYTRGSTIDPAHPST